MIDKIVLLNKNKAFIIFTHKKMIEISSDKNAFTLLMWLLGHPRSDMFIINNSPQIELKRDCGDEITLNINRKDVA